MQIRFPLQIDSRGRTATSDEDAHVRAMIEQVLFTSPGERVNRPTFGCGLDRLVFGGNSDELATATQFLVQSALQQWLGDVIHVEAVTVAADDAQLRVAVQYLVRRSQQRRVAQFVREA
ncbi:MAG TPA: GPW/gp25 family protein [Roseiflexaceae bacterium]|nr:GPW/gp25 family protein [Roseiflexaceae bacterium]HMP40111.1 GPW/gp25 family protein [Roseiflexaceae bacterium]